MCEYPYEMTDENKSCPAQAWEIPTTKYRLVFPYKEWRCKCTVWALFRGLYGNRLGNLCERNRHPSSSRVVVEESQVTITKGFGRGNICHNPQGSRHEDTQGWNACLRYGSVTGVRFGRSGSMARILQRRRQRGQWHAGV